MKTTMAALLVGWIGMGAGAAALAADDAMMMSIAKGSGCLTCHHIDPGGKGPEGLPPIGPAWRDVATKYRGVAGSQEALTRTVLAGSNPYASHWKGKVSGLAMPPNEVAIKEGDAKDLVAWILALPAGPSKP